METLPPDDRVVALLEAILAEQRAMRARQDEALANQAQAIALQQDLQRRAKRSMRWMLIGLAVVLAVGYLSPLAMLSFYDR
jgi:hypothetical protein